MPQIAGVGAAQRQQHIEVRDAEVGVVGGGTADPGAEPQIAAQQGGELGAAFGTGDAVGVPELVGGDPVLLGGEASAFTVSQVAAARVPPSASGIEQQPASQLWPVRVM